jgi:hypothetical protein
MQLWQYYLLVTARLLYMFRTLSASIIRSVQWQPTSDILTGYISSRPMHQWLLLQFLVLLMMDAESVQNM